LQQVREEAKARGTSTLMLRRVLEATSGCTLLHFTCALWVYNCSGLPLALQKVGAEGPRLQLQSRAVTKMYVSAYAGLLVAEGASRSVTQ
jgi:hypothetical protein